jgi:hypothetical protein
VKEIFDDSERGIDITPRRLRRHGRHREARDGRVHQPRRRVVARRLEHRPVLRMTGVSAMASRGGSPGHEPTARRSSTMSFGGAVGTSSPLAVVRTNSATRASRCRRTAAVTVSTRGRPRSSRRTRAS